MKTIKRLIRKAITSLLVAAVIGSSGIMLSAKNALAYNAGIEAFVNSLYSDCLGRSADPTGFNVRSQASRQPMASSSALSSLTQQ